MGAASAAAEDAVGGESRSRWRKGGIVVLHSVSPAVLVFPGITNISSTTICLSGDDGNAEERNRCADNPSSAEPARRKSQGHAEEGEAASGPHKDST
jgi:hypothetical protein